MNPAQEKVVNLFWSGEYSTVAFIAGNQCLGPDTIIDSPDGPRPVSEIKERHLVYTWNGERAVIIMADPPYIKAHEPCYRITLSNGKWFDCSASHRVLTNKDYLHVSHILKDAMPSSTHIVGADGSQVRVVKVESLGEKPIYDFEVPVYHNYIAAGVIHHNSGKTYCMARMCFGLWLRDKAKSGDVYWCIAPNQEKSVTGQQKELWQSLPRWMFVDADYDDKNGFGAIRPTINIRTSDGGTCAVRFKNAAQYSADPRSFEQEAVNGIWIDESIAEHEYQALIPRTVAKNAFILVSAIPDVQWMFDAFENPKPGARVALVKAGIDVNKNNLGDGAIDRMIASMSSEEAQMRVYGNFRFLQGLVYPEFQKEYAPVGHLCKPFRVPDKWPRMRAIDWGNAHPTVCLWVAVAPNETIYVYREYTARYRSVQGHAKTILDLSAGETFVDKPLIDPSCYNRNQANAASVADEFAKHGLPCRPAVRTNVVGEWALVQRVKARLEARTDLGPMLQVFDTCQHLIWEFRRWKYKTDNQGKPMASDAFEDKDNDACFVAGTMVDTEHGPVAIEQVKAGTMVRSVDGWTRVLVGGTKTGTKEVVRVCFDNGRSVSCTPDHRFYFGNGSQIRADQSLGVPLCKSTPSSVAEKRLCSMSSTAESDGIATPVLVDSLPSISGELKLAVVEAGRSFCTDRFTSTTSDRHPTGSTSTTLTETETTTIRQTLRQCQHPTTPNCIRKLQSRGESVQKPGTHPKPDCFGTDNTQETSGNTHSQSRMCVVRAEQRSCPKNHTERGGASFAPQRVVRKRGTQNERILSTKNARFAEAGLSPTSTTTHKPAHLNAAHVLVSSIEPAGMRDVYCLATANGSFSVEGVAVKNCDALKYIIASNITGLKNIKVISTIDD